MVYNRSTLKPEFKMKKVNIACVPTSNNKKTGNIPQVKIGHSDKETRASCKCVKCPLLPNLTIRDSKGQKVKKEGNFSKKSGLDFPCYAWMGTVRKASWSMNRKIGRLKERIKVTRDDFEKKKLKAVYTLDSALENRRFSAKMIRIGMFGDPAIIGASQALDMVSKIKDNGIDILGYTRGWKYKFSQHWKGFLMASCTTIEEGDQAVEKGWRASVVLPIGNYEREFKSPNGNTVRVCDFYSDQHIADQGVDNIQQTDCNSCGQCVAEKDGPIIGFITHR